QFKNKVYPVPRGGVSAAFLVNGYVPFMEFVSDPAKADYFIDDLIASARTMETLCDQFPGKPFRALVDKRTDLSYKNQWVVCPWEQTAEVGITDHISRLIQYAGDDPGREGLQETPARVAKAWEHWCSGYNADVPG